MKQKTKQEDLMVRYLLGDLTEEEQVQIEELFFADNHYFEQLRSVEDALIDDYAQGILTEHERRKVEGLLLSSPRQAREIGVVRDIIRHVSESPFESISEQTSIQPEHTRKSHSLPALLRIRNLGERFPLAMTVLLVAIVLFVVIWHLSLQRKIWQMAANQAAMEKRNQEQQQQIDKQEDSHEAIIKELESERKKSDQLERDLTALQESRSQNLTSEVAILYLRANSFSRGGGELKTAHIPPGLSRFQIRINLGREENYKSYSAEIKTFDGREIWSNDQISPSRANLGKIAITLPASVFNTDDYILTLKGRTETKDIVEIGDYSFRIKK